MQNGRNIEGHVKIVVDRLITSLEFSDFQKSTSVSNGNASAMIVDRNNLSQKFQEVFGRYHEYWKEPKVDDRYRPNFSLCMMPKTRMHNDVCLYFKFHDEDFTLYANSFLPNTKTLDPDHEIIPDDIVIKYKDAYINLLEINKLKNILRAAVIAAN